MYKKYLHTLMSKYCSNVIFLIVHLYSKHYIKLFFTSRRNTTFSSKVGETGVGETGVGEQGISHFEVYCKPLEILSAKIFSVSSLIIDILANINISDLELAIASS